LEFLRQIGDLGGIEGRVALEHFVDGSENVRESSDGREGLLAATAVAVSDAGENERGIDNVVACHGRGVRRRVGDRFDWLAAEFPEAGGSC